MSATFFNLRKRKKLSTVSEKKQVAEVVKKATTQKPKKGGVKND